MLNVICARWGTGFEGYAERLQAMVGRYLTMPHTFHCYEGDELDEYAPPKLWRHCDHRPTLYRGYPLLFCFNPKLPITGRILFLGLDLVITDNIDELVNMPGDFIAIRDWIYGNLNNSVMMFNAGAHADLFNDFPSGEMTTEQDWISKRVKSPLTWPDPWVRSYKFHNCASRIPEGCKVVVFHGTPKNHQVNDAWVKEAWQ